MPLSGSGSLVDAAFTLIDRGQLFPGPLNFSPCNHADDTMPGPYRSSLIEPHMLSKMTL